MRDFSRRILIIAFVFIFFALALNAQTGESKKKRALRITEKVAEFTLKKTANIAVESGKFVGKRVIVPFAKNVAWPVAKGAPPLAAKGIELAAKGVVKGAKAVMKRDDGDAKDSKSASGN